LSHEGIDEQRIFFQGQLLRVYHLAQRFEEARARVGQWLERAGANRRKWYMLRLCLIDLAAEDYARCIENCRQWLADDPDDPDLRNWLLMALRQAGRCDEAALLAISWLSAQPEDPWIVDVLAQVLIAGRRHDEAIELLVNQQATYDTLENQLTALDKLVNAYVQTGRYAEAIAAARELIARDRRPYEQQLELFEKLGGIYTRARRFDEAVNHYQTMLRQAQSDQERAQLLRRIAFVHLRQGRLDLTLSRLREAYDLDPTDEGINNDLGYTLADMDMELDEAERMLRLAVGEDYMQPAYLDSLGWGMYKQGQLDEARIWLERARALESGEDPVIFDHLGDVYWRLGERERARDTWQQALQIQSDRQDDIYTEPNEEVIAAIQAKLEAVRKGDAPQVATIPAAGE